MPQVKNLPYMLLIKKEHIHPSEKTLNIIDFIIISIQLLVNNNSNKIEMKNL